MMRIDIDWTWEWGEWGINISDQVSPQAARRLVVPWTKVKNIEIETVALGKGYEFNFKQVEFDMLPAHKSSHAISRVSSSWSPQKDLVLINRFGIH